MNKTHSENVLNTCFSFHRGFYLKKKKKYRIRSALKWVFKKRQHRNRGFSPQHSVSQPLTAPLTPPQIPPRLRATNHLLRGFSDSSSATSRWKEKDDARLDGGHGRALGTSTMNTASLSHQFRRPERPPRRLARPACESRLQSVNHRVPGRSHFLRHRELEEIHGKSTVVLL